MVVFFFTEKGMPVILWCCAQNWPLVSFRSCLEGGYNDRYVDLQSTSSFEGKIGRIATKFEIKDAGKFPVCLLSRPD